MIHVFIVHPSRLVCETIAVVLSDEQDIRVAGFATHLTAAVSQLPDCHVALISTSFPHDGPIKVIQAALELNPALKVLVMGDNLESEHEIIQYIEAGATGYVYKKEAPPELVKNIRAVYAGKALISPQVAALLMSRISELAGMWIDGSSKDYDTFDLTPREREVLELLGHGLSNHEIAAELVVEVGTVKNHVHNILKKLDISSRRDVIAYMGLVQNDLS
jgi:DNA-binding NarL/FixJ family response regulator